MSLPDAPAVIAVDDLDELDPIPEGYRVLDLRTEEEWDAGHVPDSLNIPYEDLEDRAHELDFVEDEDGNIEEFELILVCRDGSESREALDWFTESGFEALCLQGGMLAWADASLPLAASGDVPSIW